jgi:release factor glutamine methyltransferase
MDAATALDTSMQRLLAAGVESSAAEARWLVRDVLGTGSGLLDPHTPLTASQAERLIAMVDRRANREPLQHILGTAPFRYLEVEVGPGVFVPRPETELLVDLVLSKENQPARVVDLCSGSGAIALSFAQERPAAEVWAVEKSPEALEWLERNASLRAEAGDRSVHVIAADIADPLLLTDPALLGRQPGRIDIVVCNPPYVPTGVQVGPEVGHDPVMAVFSGADGLDTIRVFIPVAQALLRQGGLVAVEHDESHQQAVLELFAAPEWDGVQGHNDLTGRARFVTGRKT